MKDQQILLKGELMEELLRNYFLSLGYYVVRGAAYRYKKTDITDVDLFLYGRTSSLTRQRINVDIKNKKTPQAMERILWANGLMKLLKFDSCVVATPDKRPIIQSFAQLHNTTLFDGSFIARIKTNRYPNRLSEEDLLIELVKYKSYNAFGNRSWKDIYEDSKSKVLIELDFSGFNSILMYIKYFFEKVIIDSDKREVAARLIYILVSHLLITIDFILRDIAFLEQTDRERKLSDGFKFGNLGKEGAEKIIDLAIQISGSNTGRNLLSSLNDLPIDILKEFFGKNENAKSLFIWAKEFEAIGFKKDFLNPLGIDSPLKGVISVLLDHGNIERRKFFNVFN